LPIKLIKSHFRAFRHDQGVFIMRCLVFLTVVVLALFLAGCEEVSEDMEHEILSQIPVIGWFWSDHGSSAAPVKKTEPDKAATPNLTSKLPPMPPLPKCPEHQFWNQMQNACSCEADYYMDNGRCVLKATRECVVDRDCSPNGQLSVCSGAYAKKVYYCDLSTYHCVGGKGVGTTVDCRTEYGPKYKCVGGNCVE
jgi:hypothetical protein